MLIVHLFVSYAHVNLFHLFSSFWCRELAAASVCGSSWTFLFTFLKPKLITCRSVLFNALCIQKPFEPLHKKTCLRGLRQVKTEIGLLS